jgi:membrane protein implicated in regulation of membrane protease activity
VKLLQIAVAVVVVLSLIAALGWRRLQKTMDEAEAKANERLKPGPEGAYLPG